MGAHQFSGPTPSNSVPGSPGVRQAAATLEQRIRLQMYASNRGPAAEQWLEVA